MSESWQSRVEGLMKQRSAKIREIYAATKAQHDSGSLDQPNDEVLRLRSEFKALSDEIDGILTSVQNELGITDEQLEAWDQRHAGSTDLFWKHNISRMPTTASMDESIGKGLEALLRLVDPKWLGEERKKLHRLPAQYLTEPLEIVSGTTRPQTNSRSQRFARMLLVAEDYLKNVPNVDFFSGALLISEVAHLGTQLDRIRELGGEGARRLNSLPSLPDGEVASTVYELLVGAGCVRLGRKIEALPATTRKTPDFRIHDLPAPSVLECKRKADISEYEIAEAASVRALYDAARDVLPSGIVVDVSFSIPLSNVTPGDFRTEIGRLKFAVPNTPIDHGWGVIQFEERSSSYSFPDTKLYAPNFLRVVFGWREREDRWDGLICEVEPPDEIVVGHARRPRALRWRSNSEEARTKKARVPTSLVGDAFQQIPPGEAGFIYVSYREGARAELADARTSGIIENAKGEWFHRWVITVPQIVFNRVYAAPIGSGAPDLIDSALPLVLGDSPVFHGILPTISFLPDEATEDE